MSSATTTTSASSPPTEAAFSVRGMDCASCVAHVERAARGVPGVRGASVSLARGRATVTYDPAAADPSRIAEAITASGYVAVPESPGIAAGNVEEERLQHQRAHARAWFRRAVIGAVLWFPVEALHWLLKLTSDSAHAQHRSGGGLWMEWLALATSTAALLLVGGAFYRSAWGALRRGTSNMDTLIAMGATVAWGYSAVAFAGYLGGAWHALPDLYFMESAGLLALISLGHWLEARARESAGSAIRQLMNLSPATALRLRENGRPDAASLFGSASADAASHALSESSAKADPANRSLNVLTDPYEEVPVSALHVGDRVLVRPGDRVATDGVVVNGRSGVDESMITGESLPVPRGAGDAVIGGTVNGDGRLVVRVTKVGAETALAQIVKLVEHAQSSKPPVQQLADRVAAVFVPIVLGIALATGAGWYAWGAAHDWPAAQTWGMIARAVCSVLIIACPCALGLAVPAALMVGTGLGARRGILIRDIDALQKAERIDTVVLDKTGTVTQGRPAVLGVTAFGAGVTEDDILRMAAAAEQYSEHPLAKAVVAHARGLGLRWPEPARFDSDPGHGVVAVVDGQELLVGSESLLAKHGLAGPVGAGEGPGTPDPAQSLVYVARKGNGGVVLLGLIALSDPLKSDSVEAVRELRAMRLRTVLLTGDNEATARHIAAQVGIEDVRAGVKPGGKADVVRALQNPQSAIRNPRSSSVAMVGDGVNDAPALAAADLGIAIGSGSDVAKETGDIVLVSGSLRGVASAIRLSRATMTKIRQNLFFALLYNCLAIPLAALGLLNPLVAAGAMALSDVTVLGNALLLRRAKV
jgi:Cu+-exporting ATPase